MVVKWQNIYASVMEAATYVSYKQSLPPAIFSFPVFLVSPYHKIYVNYYPS